MPVAAIEREIHDACVHLASSAAAARRCAEHYLDGTVTPAGAVRALGAVGTLTAEHPWALGSFDDRAWDGYQPDPHAPAPDGLRVGRLRAPLLSSAPGLPTAPAVARLARYGHVLISEHGFADQARSLLQALVLRLATATAPGTVRFALADPVGQGRHLSAFLRLPPPLRVGSGVAARPDEIEDLLTTLSAHVVEVTQHRLTNVYDSIEDYNAATTGVLVPYHVLVLAGLPAGLGDQAEELLGNLARNGPRAGLYILATVDPGAPAPEGWTWPR